MRVLGVQQILDQAAGQARLGGMTIERHRTALGTQTGDQAGGEE